MEIRSKPTLVNNNNEDLKRIGEYHQLGLNLFKNPDQPTSNIAYIETVKDRMANIPVEKRRKYFSSFIDGVQRVVNEARYNSINPETVSRAQSDIIHALKSVENDESSDKIVKKNKENKNLVIKVEKIIDEIKGGVFSSKKFSSIPEPDELSAEITKNKASNQKAKEIGTMIGTEIAKEALKEIPVLGAFVGGTMEAVKIAKETNEKVEESSLNELRQNKQDEAIHKIQKKIGLHSSVIEEHSGFHQGVRDLVLNVDEKIDYQASKIVSLESSHESLLSRSLKIEESLDKVTGVADGYMSKTQEKDYLATLHSVDNMMVSVAPFVDILAPKSDTKTLTVPYDIAKRKISRDIQVLHEADVDKKHHMGTYGFLQGKLSDIADKEGLENFINAENRIQNISAHVDKFKQRGIECLPETYREQILFSEKNDNIKNYTNTLDTILNNEFSSLWDDGSRDPGNIKNIAAVGFMAGMSGYGTATSKLAERAKNYIDFFNSHKDILVTRQEIQNFINKENGIPNEEVKLSLV